MTTQQFLCQILKSISSFWVLSISVRAVHQVAHGSSIFFLGSLFSPSSDLFVIAKLYHLLVNHP